MPDRRDDVYRVGENQYMTGYGDPNYARSLFGLRQDPYALQSSETVDVRPSGGPPPIMNRSKDYHPADMREGLMEKAIKYAAKNSGSLLKDDRVYLEQYLHPERDIIPKQPLRPTQLSKMPNMEFRRLPSYQPLADEPNYTVPNLGGLGNYTVGENDDYMSYYDTWDFDTNAQLIGGRNPSRLDSIANWGAKKLMQYAGTPFAVYERIPKGEQR